MSFFDKLSKAFTDDKSTNPGERDQVIRETKKTTRLLKDGDWIRNKQSDESQNSSVDVNYGKVALNRVKSEESLNRDSSGLNKVTTPTKSDTIDGRKSGTVDLNKTQRTSTLDKPARYRTVFSVSTSEPFQRLPNKVVLSRYRSEEILNRDSDTTDSKSPTTKYSSLDRYNRNYSYKTEETSKTTKTTPDGKTTTQRTSQFKTDELPKMTIITSETKTGSPTSKSLQSRASPDGQVTTPEKTSSKTIRKWDSQKDETPGTVSTSKTSTLERNTVKTSTKSEPAPLIDLTPTTEKSSKGSSDFMSKFGSKSLIDLSIAPEKTNERTPSTTPTTPSKTSSLIDLTPTTPDKPKRSSGEWDNINSSTPTSSKATFDPTSRKTRSSSGDKENINTYTTTNTKTSFDPTSKYSRSSSGDKENTNTYTTTSTKTTFNPASKYSRSSSGDKENTNTYTSTSTKTSFDPPSNYSSNNDWDSITSSTTTSTKTTFDPDTETSRSTSQQDLLSDEPAYKTSTSYTKTSRTFSSNSSGDKSPAIDEHQYTSRSSYKENSPPYDDDESSSYRSSNYSLQRNKNSSSSLSDGKNPAKVITLTTNYTSAGQTTKDKNVCSQCFKPFNNAPKMILEDLDINCHASCLKCQICHQSLENLNAGDNVWVHHHTVHCEKCYDKVKAQLGF